MALSVHSKLASERLKNEPLTSWARVLSFYRVRLNCIPTSNKYTYKYTCKYTYKYTYGTTQSCAYASLGWYTLYTYTWDAPLGA